jgi:hypothetical protein
MSAATVFNEKRIRNRVAEESVSDRMVILWRGTAT